MIAPERGSADGRDLIGRPNIAKMETLLTKVKRNLASLWFIL
jgi:hypothetical protein